MRGRAVVALGILVFFWGEGDAIFLVYFVSLGCRFAEMVKAADYKVIRKSKRVVFLVLEGYSP